MSYAPDPGGVFDSDAHRRVCGHLPSSGSEVAGLDVDALAARLAPDAASDLNAGEVSEILGDLEAAGYASQSNEGWKLTKKGLDALCAPAQEG